MNKKRETLTAYAFLAPTLILFVAFIAIPIVFSLFLSFTEWDFLSGLRNLKWVGLENFRDMAKDKHFIQAVGNTFIYAAATVPTSIIIALGLAAVLNSKIYFKKTLRFAFFIPYISNAVALSTVFKVMFRENGPINMVLMNMFGIENAPRWFADSNLNKIPIIVMVIWTAIGYEMIIYMAALQNISASLYEAAEIDGATGMQKFMRITFPLITPTTFYLLIVRLIAVFKLFTPVNIMTMATPARANTSMVVRIYSEAFSSYKFGYASAEAWVLFVIILAITLFQFWGQKKWVHY